MFSKLTGSYWARPWLHQVECGLECYHREISPWSRHHDTLKRARGNYFCFLKENYDDLYLTYKWSHSKKWREGEGRDDSLLGREQQKKEKAIKRIGNSRQPRINLLHGTSPFFTWQATVIWNLLLVGGLEVILSFLLSTTETPPNLLAPGDQFSSYRHLFSALFYHLMNSTKVHCAVETWILTTSEITMKSPAVYWQSKAF